MSRPKNTISRKKKTKKSIKRTKKSIKTIKKSVKSTKKCTRGRCTARINYGKTRCNNCISKEHLCVSHYKLWSKKFK